MNCINISGLQGFFTETVNFEGAEWFLIALFSDLNAVYKYVKF